MVVYLLRNTTNGKCYVGKTVRTLKARWAQHVCRAKSGEGAELHSDIRAYGADVFQRVVLSEALNIQALAQLEKFWIKQFRTIYPNGYNLTAGGDKDFTYEPVTRERMRTAKLGRHLSPSTRAKMSAVRIGKKQSTETVAKRLATFARRKNDR